MSKKAKINTLTSEQILNQLRLILDPELAIDIVSLGLVYDVSIGTVQAAGGPHEHIHILMTLTTPGCPLATVIEDMIHRQLDCLEGIDGWRDVTIEVTFDPPWTLDMVTEEAKAELGF